jgi:hypothetical protein
MTTPAWKLYSCDDHLDLWNLPKDVWTDRLSAAYRERGPRVVDQGAGGAWWTCDGSVMGMHGLSGTMKDYSATTRTGVDDDGLRPSDPTMRLQDMDLDGVYASVIYGPNLFGLPIADPELKAACLGAYNDWAADFNRVEPARLAVLPVLPTIRLRRPRPSSSAPPGTDIAASSSARTSSAARTPNGRGSGTPPRRSAFP